MANPFLKFINKPETESKQNTNITIYDNDVWLNFGQNSQLVKSNRSWIIHNIAVSFNLSFDETPNTTLDTFVNNQRKTPNIDDEFDTILSFAKEEPLENKKALSQKLFKLSKYIEADIAYPGRNLTSYSVMNR